MRVLVVFLCLLGAANAELLEMTVSGPEAGVPGLATVRATGPGVPAYAPTDLSVMPGWPKVVASGLFSPARGVALVDFDGDGRQEVIMPANTSVHVWKYDGTYYPGWPANLSGDSCQYAAAVADVNLDGQFEVAVGTRSFVGGNGPVYLFGENGSLMTGWPFRGGGGYFNEAPTLSDVDGDDTLEVIVCERRGNLGYLYVVRHDGRLQPGSWPVTLDHVPATGAAAGDLDGDGSVEIVQASYSSMYAFSSGGTVRAGWPVTMPNGRNWSYQSPALADIDGDDTLEIVTAMHKDGGASIVFRHDGKVQPGWPQTYGYWTYCPPTVCDLYRDGDLKVLCGTSAGVSGFSPVQHAHDGDGAVLSGFPFVSQTGSNEPNLTVADVDGDEDMEVLVTSNRITNNDSLGYVYALHHDGSEVSGFPLRPWGFTYLNGPNVADVDGDDSLDIIAVSEYAGQMHVTIWEAGVPFSRMSWEWPTYQFDMARTGVYRWAQVGVAEQRSRAAQRGLAVRPSMTRAGAVVRLSAVSGSGVTLIDASGRNRGKLQVGADGSARLPSELGAGVYVLRSGEGAARLVVRD